LKVAGEDSKGRKKMSLEIGVKRIPVTCWWKVESLATLNCDLKSRKCV
jgi:hypothetical protein